MKKRTVLTFLLGALFGCALVFTLSHVSLPVAHANGVTVADPRWVVVQDTSGNLTVYRDDTVAVDPICTYGNTTNCARFLFTGAQLSGAMNSLSNDIYAAKP